MDQPVRPDPATLTREALIERVRQLEEDVCELPDRTALAREIHVHREELEAQNVELRETQQALADTLERYMELYDFAPLSYVTLNRRGCIEEINLRGAGLLGSARPQLLGMPLSLWIPTPGLPVFFSHLKRAFDADRPVFDDLPMQLPRGGRHRHVRLESVPLHGRGGEAQSCRTLLVDLSDRKQDEDRLSLTAQVFERSIDPILITDRGNRIVSVNLAFTRVTGYKPEEVLGRDPKFLASGRHDREFYRNMWNALTEDGLWIGEICNRRKNGETCPEWLTIHAVKNQSGGIENCIAIYGELSDQREAASRIQFLAHYDSLTQLPNRSLLQDRLHQALTHAAREKAKAALLFLDLDRFKSINDSLGHLVGDRLLQAVGERLRHCVREDDTVSRRGGDEFILLLPALDEAEAAVRVAEKIVEAMAQPFQVDCHQLNVTFSIGISVYPDDGTDAEDLIKNADVAMYRAKESGRNNFQFFAPSMNAHAVERLALETGLHRALEREEFTLYYQPQVDSRDARILGMEALLRWRHPEWGLVPPSRFIPVAEESGLVVPLGEWALRRACEEVCRWRREGLTGTTLAVNISALQFRQENLVEIVADVLRTTGLEAGCLELELTESALMQDDPVTQGRVRALNDMGVRLSIDDFGIGYSSLSYLRTFPIHKLKIDRSFVRDLTCTQDADAIAAAIIAMGRNLNLTVLAEGVETAEQARFLLAQHCDEIQGNYYSEPVPAWRMGQLLRAGRIDLH